MCTSVQYRSEISILRHAMKDRWNSREGENVKMQS